MVSRDGLLMFTIALWRFSKIGLTPNHPSHLVGGFNHSEKYDFVSWDDKIPN